MDPHNHVVPPVIPKDKSAVDNVTSPTLSTAMEESNEEEFLPEEVEGVSCSYCSPEGEESEREIACSYQLTEEERIRANLPNVEC